MTGNGSLRNFVDSEFYSFGLSQLRYRSYFCFCMRCATSPLCQFLSLRVFLTQYLSKKFSAPSLPEIYNNESSQKVNCN